MRPGPPPQPLELKLLRGNPGKRSLPKHTVTPTAGADCPRELSPAARAEWRRLQPELERLGLLTQIDRAAMASYCEAWSDFRWSVQRIRRSGRTIEAGNGTLIPHPAIVIKRQAMELIRKFASEFGFTPSARARLSLGAAVDKDPQEEEFFGPRPAPAPRPAAASKKSRG